MNFLRSVKISTKLAIGFGSLFVLVFVMGGVWQSGVSKQQKASIEAMEMSDLLAQLRLMQIQHYKWMDGLRQWVRGKDKFSGQTDPTKCAFGKWYYSYRCPVESLQKFFADLEEPHRKLHESGHETVLAMEKGDVSSADKISLYARDHLFVELMKIYDPFVEGIMKEEENKEDRGARVARNQKITAAVMIAVGLCLVVFFWLVISRAITRPIRKVVEMVEDLAQGEGDLTKKIEVDTQDELGELARWFNLFIDKLHGIIVQIANTTVQAATASQEASASSEELASGAEEQQAQAAQVATSMEEMSATVQEVARNAHEAAASAKDAGATAQKGGEIIQQTVDGIKRIAESSKSTAEAIQVLTKNSGKIGNIISVIEDVADQTNLLALNAAIEAARAGDQGRGFAVVADEVRKLAERTSSSTKEIAAMVKAMQEGTVQASGAMEQGMRDVEKGVRLAEQAGGTLEEIVVSAQRVMDLVRQVATAAEEQSAAAEEISSNVESVSSVSKQSAMGVSQIAAAAQEVAKLADGLQSLVNKFKLRSGSVLKKERAKRA